MKIKRIKVIYEDENLLTIDKPPNLIVFPEAPSPFAKTSEDKKEKTLIDYLLKNYPDLKNVGKPPRYGIVHRLDKNTSGILLIAKNNKALYFLQEQFKERKVIKKYIALVVGNPKQDFGEIETLIGRAPKNRKKQKIYLPHEPDSKGKRKAITEYKVLERFDDYTLIEAAPKTGRKHQIRVHLAFIHHPIAGDKMYGFKNQPCPKGLKRQFLHAKYLKIKMLNGKEKEFKLELPKDLKEVLQNYDD